MSYNPITNAGTNNPFDDVSRIAIRISTECLALSVWPLTFSFQQVQVPPPSFGASASPNGTDQYAYPPQQANNTYGTEPQMPNNGYQQPTQSYPAHPPSYGNYQM